MNPLPSMYHCEARKVNPSDPRTYVLAFSVPADGTASQTLFRVSAWEGRLLLLLLKCRAYLRFNAEPRLYIDRNEAARYRAERDQHRANARAWYKS